MTWTPKFKKGDIIISSNGTRASIIESVANYGGGYYDLKYLHNNKCHTLFSYPESNYSLYEDAEMTQTKTLYSFIRDDGTVSYGTHIGTNSQNQYLIEEKVTGAIHVLEKTNLEEVLPYTFSVSMDGADYHYVGKPDTLSVGDLLLNVEAKNPRVAVVTAIDTKNKTPRSKFKGRKLVTQEI